MLTTGDILQLEVFFAQGEVERYKTKVESLEGHYLYITYPTNINTQKTEFFKEGTHFNVTFSTKNNQSFTFHSELIGRKKRNMPLLVLSYPGDHELVKFQRRKYVRIDATLDAAIHSPNQTFESFTSITTDISGGGCAVSLPENHGLQSGQNVICWIVLPLQGNKLTYIKQLSKVRRITEQDTMNQVKASLEFIDIKDDDRNLIIRYCFERQLELKQKGLLG